MKKGCLLFVIITLFIVFSAGLFIWSKKDAIVSSVKNAFELPEHGTEKYIKSRYGVLLDELDNAAKEATTFFKFAATIEAIQLPEEVIYIGIVKDKERIDVIKNLTWNGHSLRTMNRYGAGTLSVNGDKVKIMTYETIPSPK